MNTTPLAAQLRPHSLNHLVGRDEITAPGTPLRRIIDNIEPIPSAIMYGPPGSGKTSILTVVTTATPRPVIHINGTHVTMKQLREATSHTDVAPVVIIDEIHRLTSTQYDALLPAVEEGRIVLLGATTENPSFTIAPALRSRVHVVEIKPITRPDMVELITSQRVADVTGVTITDDAADAIASASHGDARRALTIIEHVIATGDTTTINVDDLHGVIATVAANYDAGGDKHYDITSAWIKAMRGSDPDAALHWLARMIDGGEDPRFIARRLVIHASEDVGMADSSVMATAVAATYAAHNIGFPEARIPLAHATVAIAMAPKSNGIIAAINAALEDVRSGNTGEVPDHLKDSHYEDATQYNRGVGYLYPHDYVNGIVDQSYGPVDMNDIRGRYYQPTNHGREHDMRVILNNIAAARLSPEKKKGS